MTFLLLCIASSTAVPVVFKLLERYRITLFPVIVLNYLTAFGLGVALSGSTPADMTIRMHQQPWFWPALFIGALLILMFFIIGLSTQKAGIAPTILAGKMSVVIPILFSIFHYGEQLNWHKILGILAALAALFLIVLPGAGPRNKSGYRFLPVLLFVGIGTLEALMKLVQQAYIPDRNAAAFTGTAFLIAFCIGTAVAVIRQTRPAAFFSPKPLGAGIILGIVNFGSVYFLIKSLDAGILDSSVIFAVNSVGIVLCSVCIAVLAFREYLTGMNRLGVLLGLAAIVLFMYA